jgi:hypothetical protein
MCVVKAASYCNGMGEATIRAWSGCVAGICNSPAPDQLTVAGMGSHILARPIPMVGSFVCGALNNAWCGYELHVCECGYWVPQ